MIREDISYNLVHLCKGDGNNEAKRRENAAKSFLDIVTSEKLVGGTGFIKGQYKCICMSETPPKTLANILSQKEGSEFKYQPYGIMFEKSYIYSLGDYLLSIVRKQTLINFMMITSSDMLPLI
ncbi:hypothetical protein QYZ43_11230 [Vibrio parahaemolyticus]|nr:hypothetical protein [Vibrio parahaemolyticus]MDN4718075.1 hypothetical protein [Vibrio parahaemolyticus]MDN4721288.1 hypothetical protein [Vibrio parahaemolyticus]MDN4725570.1 hypothetical protein [Vibrio parahaemolyticus]MDN4729100.1 hypothetical protein [Vibrio parahaemolyticus]